KMAQSGKLRSRADEIGIRKCSGIRNAGIYFLHNNNDLGKLFIVADYERIVSGVTFVTGEIAWKTTSGQ
ncbi:MAG: hypothetical protein KDE10_10860, partial [Rhodobacteraceae bacterium]|nr:hypothetical protein [Paracoccaceae bacterium]